MPLYEFLCLDCGEKQEHMLAVDKRDQTICCDACQSVMKRLPGGHKMLHFEEGRGRIHIGLGDKPITSYAQRDKIMRDHGLVESGNTIPPSILKKGPASEGMKRFMEKGQKGKWE